MAEIEQLRKELNELRERVARLEREAIHVRPYYAQPVPVSQPVPLDQPPPWTITCGIDRG